MTIQIATVNVNGIRAATRDDPTRPRMPAWLEEHRPDIVAAQETRANDEIVAAAFGPKWHVDTAEGDKPGRAGVAVASLVPSTFTRVGLGDGRFVRQGRWIESTFALADGSDLVVISSYVHTGDHADDARMEEKLAFMVAAVERVDELAKSGLHVLWTGDLNVAHTELDIKNWKGNLGKAGFLLEEREILDDLIGVRGFVDIGRRFGGDEPGPYSWWSYRGKAFDTDAGWRIDYLLASPELGELSTACQVHRAADYHLRWSDHAPVVATFATDLA